MLHRALLVLATLPAFAADPAVEIPPVRLSVNIADQPVAIVVSGDISVSAQPFGFNLYADFSDLQSHITPVMQAELNRSSRCGERISVENATLAPVAPAGNLTVQLHFEKWACFKAFGKEKATKLAGGNGTVDVILTPQLETDSAGNQAVRLNVEIRNIEADGSLGEMLRSEYGAVLRDKIRETLLQAIQKSAGLETVVPERVRPFVTIRSVAFAERGSGILLLDLVGRLQVNGEQVSSVIEQLRNRK